MPLPTRGWRWCHVPVAMVAVAVAEVVAFYAGSRDALGMRLAPNATAVSARALTSMLAHADAAHLWTNVASGVALGAPLEAAHGAARCAALYVVSGAGGALAYRAWWCARVAPRPVLYVGASSAVYGVMAAYAAHLALNFAEVRGRWVWLALAAATLGAEWALARWAPVADVAYSAHAGGAWVGLLLGVVVLRNVRVLECERTAQAASACALCATAVWLLAGACA